MIREEDLGSVFEKFSDDYLRFEYIQAPPSNRMDLCAFLKLDSLVPGTVDIVSAAEHDEIFLDVSPEDLARVATEDDILYLVRCGVRLSDDILAMFA